MKKKFKFEVIFIDNNSTEDTYKILKKIKKESFFT